MKTTKNWKREIIVRLALIVCFGICVLAVGLYLIPSKWAIEGVRYLTKPFFYLLVCFTFFALTRENWPHLRSRSYLPSVLTAAIVALVLISSTEYTYRVLFDEYLIPAQAKSLHEYGTSDYPDGTFETYGELKRQDSFVDKRPPVFSIFLGLMHDLSGYRIGNVFYLNTFFGFCLVLLGLLAAQIKKQDSLKCYEASAWVIIMALSLPLLTQSMTGAGMDLLNVLLLFCSGLIGWKILREERAHNRLILSWLGLNLLLFNTRYESILFVFSVGVVLLVVAIRQKKLPVYGGLLLMPLLLLPYVCRHRIFSEYSETSWQLSSDAIRPFGLEFFYANVGHSIDYLFVPTRSSNASFLLSCLGLVCLLLLVCRLFRKAMEKKKFTAFEIVYVSYGSIILFNFGLLLCYHWGRANELEASRLVLPLFLLFSVSIFAVVIELSPRYPRLVRGILLAGIVYVFSYALPQKTEAVSINGRHYQVDVDQWALEKIRGRNEANAFVVSKADLFWYLNDIAAKSIGRVESNLKAFEFQRRSRSINAYIIQEFNVNPITGEERLLEGHRLDKAYNFELIAEMSYKPYHIARISKVLETKGNALQWMNLSEEEKAFYEDYPVELWHFLIP